MFDDRSPPGDISLADALRETAESIGADGGAPEAASETAATSAPAPETDASKQEPAGDQRPRDQKGRFVEKDGTVLQAEPKEQKAPAAKPEATKDKAATASIADPAPKTGDDASAAAATESKPEGESQADQPLKPHPMWKEAHKAIFSTLPPEAQAAWLAREKEVDRAITTKSQEAATLRREAEPILTALRPFEPYLASIGASKAQAIDALLKAEYVLRTGTPQQRQAKFAEMARAYGVDMPAPSASIPPAQAAQTQQQAGDTWVDPAVQQVLQTVQPLQQEVGQLKQFLQQQAQAQQNAQRMAQQREIETLQGAIDAFATATDDTGNPKHPHYERVRATMGALVANLSQGTDPRDPNVLESLYQRAIRADDELWRDIQAAEEIRRQHEAKEKARATAQAARNAAGVMRPTPRPASQPVVQGGPLPTLPSGKLTFAADMMAQAQRLNEEAA